MGSSTERNNAVQIIVRLFLVLLQKNTESLPNSFKTDILLYTFIKDMQNFNTLTDKYGH